MPSSVPAVMAGLRTFLASWPGLTPADGVTVRSAPGIELPDDTIELSEVTAPQTGYQDLAARKAESPTMTCWCQASRPGIDETAIDAARVRAYALLALVEQALSVDASAGRTVPPPGRLVVGDSTLIQAPTDTDGSGGRRAQVRFSITWTSHIA